VRIARAAQHSLDITIPYISKSGVDILTLGLQHCSRHGLRVRILTLLTSAYQKQNGRGVARLVKRFERAGANVEVRTPTDQQSQQTGAVAVMHAKVLIADRKEGYMGTANISKAGLQRGYELGMIVHGELAERLWCLNDWVYTRHQCWQIPRCQIRDDGLIEGPN